MINRESASAHGAGMCQHGNRPDTCKFCAEEKEKSKTPAEMEEAKKMEVAEIERIRDKRLEFLLAEHADFVNEGNNGAIFKIDIAELPEDLRKELGGLGIVVEGSEKAIKILKVYNAGQGKREYEKQLRAYDIVASKKGDPSYAEVPEPHLYRDLKISKETADKLRGPANNFRATERVELLIMDFIPGKDLATLLYSEVIKRDKSLADFVPGVERMSFSNLERAVSPTLDLRVPGGKAADTSGRVHEELKIQIENAGKLFNYLAKKTDLQIHPSLIEQFSNTLSLFHQNGFVLRDAHLRNFMVKGDFAADPGKKTEVPQGFFIDFENAIETPKGLSEKEIHDSYIKAAEGIEGKNFIDPWTQIRQIKGLVVPPKERSNPEKEAAEALDAILADARKKIGQKLERNPKGLDRFKESLAKMLPKGAFTRDEAFDLFERYTLETNEAEKMNAFLATVDSFVESSPELKSASRALLEKLIEPAGKTKRGIRVKNLAAKGFNAANLYLSQKK